MATNTTLTQGIAGALAQYLAAKSAQQKDTLDKTFQQQNTEAGFYGGTRNETLQRQLAANSMSQQNPYTQFDALQKQNQRLDLAQGQDVGPKFRTASVTPGLEKFGAIPKLSFNYGSNFKAAQTPQNIANEYANSQIRQAQVSPDSPVSAMGDLFGKEIGGPLDLKTAAAATASKNEQELSKAAQLRAIREAVKQGASGSGGPGVGGALAAAGIGALSGLGGSGAQFNLDPLAAKLSDWYHQARGYVKDDGIPGYQGGQEQAPWDPSAGLNQTGPGWIQGEGLNPMSEAELLAFLDQLETVYPSNNIDAYQTMTDAGYQLPYGWF